MNECVLYTPTWALVHDIVSNWMSTAQRRKRELPSWVELGCFIFFYILYLSELQFPHRNPGIAIDQLAQGGREDEILQAQLSARHTERFVNCSPIRD